MPERESDASLARQLGERLRQGRLRQHKQQTVVAGLAGITTDYLYQIERGLKLPSLAVLFELARVLDMPLSALLGEAPSGNQSGRAVTAARNEVKKGAKPTLAFDAILVPGSLPIGDRLYVAMTASKKDCGEPGPKSGQPADEQYDEKFLYDNLSSQVLHAWHVWQHSPRRYSQVDALAPSLVTEVEQQFRMLQGNDVCSERREIARHASDLYGLLRSFCKRVGRIELSLLSAERAIRTAELADDPVRLAAAQWNLAHVLLADGQLKVPKMS